MLTKLLQDDKLKCLSAMIRVGGAYGQVSVILYILQSPIITDISYCLRPLQVKFWISTVFAPSLVGLPHIPLQFHYTEIGHNILRHKS